MRKAQTLNVKVEAEFSCVLTVDFKSSVERLLKRTPSEYLVGLSRIVLRGQDELTRGERLHRKSRLRKKRVILGLYYRKTRSREARVELFVDEIYNRWPPILMRIPPLRDALIGSTLFHEIGHHIQYAVIPGHGDPEAAANEWRRKLLRCAMKRHSWYMLPIIGAARRLLGLIVRKRKP